MALSNVLLDIAGESLLLLLLLTMITSLILGMGLPTTACYIILAVLVAPALVKMGVDIIAAHLFVFYFGILSVITPPEALAAYVAAGIANANPFKTGWFASKLGLNDHHPYVRLRASLALEGTITEIRGRCLWCDRIGSPCLFSPGMVSFEAKPLGKAFFACRQLIAHQAGADDGYDWICNSGDIYHLSVFFSSQA
jgi:hypothetical protein